MTFDELVVEARERQKFNEWFDFVSEEEELQEAWDELQAVPSYVSRDKSAETGFARE